MTHASLQPSLPASTLARGSPFCVSRGSGLGMWSRFSSRPSQLAQLAQIGRSQGVGDGSGGGLTELTELSGTPREIKSASRGASEALAHLLAIICSPQLGVDGEIGSLTAGTLSCACGRRLEPPRFNEGIEGQFNFGGIPKPRQLPLSYLAGIDRVRVFSCNNPGNNGRQAICLWERGIPIDPNRHGFEIVFD